MGTLSINMWKNIKGLGCGNSLFVLNRFCSTVPNDPSQNNDKMLTKEKAHALIMNLNIEERENLIYCLNHLESEETKAEYRGQLAGFRWRSKFGRPSKVPKLGDVDPTGSFCPLPDEWLKTKYAEAIPRPTRMQLFRVGLHNAIPFIMFGFLDNSVMLICGESIERTVGALITISTMAAAAIGNTFSDILGIGSSYYVEQLVTKLGLKPPSLTPIQLDMSCSRHAANLGRTLGVTLGCILGMFPLLFKKDDESKDENSEDITEK
ncbi:transmembrane protein 65 isoform X2 [Adelges cooleyi]|uniref:transmembrane protein 65 isoform X2 n=1 Tax=Adelges cooleyi TaxID=133065 RepID=UPI0021802AD2|nr:transmembrane protein 65 isoform X2 [Adelges cooleyi]